MTVLKDREPGSISVPVGTFPATSTSTDIDADTVAAAIIDQLNAASAQKDPDAVAALFLEDSFWRDHLSVSFDFHTIKGRANIAAFLRQNPDPITLEIDRSSPFHAPHVGPIDALGPVTGVEFFVRVTTSSGTGRGIVRLAEEAPGTWKIFTIYTSLRALPEVNEKVYHHRPVGVQHGAQQDRTNWRDRRTAETNFDGQEPAVLIIGAGQAGLSIAARLKALNVPALIIDREDRIGDNWRTRYHQLVLHDPVWFDHMPYLPFPSTWPIFTPKDKLADFFESYATLLDLNVWTRTSLSSATYSDDTKSWTVEVETTADQTGGTTTRTLRPVHIIQATGHSGKKNLPAIPGMDSFQGGRLCHSSDFPGAGSNGTGKRAIVVGACNSAHDIVQDYHEKGWEVTMVQRSTTCVVSSGAITNIGLKGLYEEAGPATDDSDLFLWSIPSELFKAQQIGVTAAQATYDAEILSGLKKAGFGIDSGPENSGLLMKYLQRGGGYYIDVGASKLVVEGQVGVKHGVEIEKVTATGLTFADGSELAADEIIFATGYQNMRTQAREIFGDEVADRVGDVWGFDAEGEIRTMWRRSGHPGLWFMGGNLALCRYYSLLLALQVRAAV